MISTYTVPLSAVPFFSFRVFHVFVDSPRTRERHEKKWPLAMRVFHVIDEPGAGEGPVAIGRGAREARQLGRFFDRQAGKIPELYEQGGRRVFATKLLQRLVEQDQLIGGCARRQVRFGQFDAAQGASVPKRFLPPGAFDKNPPHGFRGSREKMGPPLPATALPSVLRRDRLIGPPDQTQIRFVDEGRGLECLARRLLGQLPSRQAPQLVIDKRQKLLGPLRLAALDCRQNLRHVGHDFQYNRPQSSPMANVESESRKNDEKFDARKNPWNRNLLRCRRGRVRSGAGQDGRAPRAVSAARRAGGRSRGLQDLIGR